MARPVSSDSGCPSIDTPRLLLRLPAWEATCAIVAGERQDDWVADYPDDGDIVIASMVHRAGKREHAPEDARWAHRQIVERSSGVVVGGVGFFGPPDNAEVEIGFGIVPSRRGKGYATEAVGAMVTLAWAEPRVEAILAGTDVDNRVSQRVLEKAGFHRIASTDGVRYRRTRVAAGQH